MLKNQNGGSEPEKLQNQMMATLTLPTNKCSSEMSMEQLNEYLVNRSKGICENVRKSRVKRAWTSDIVPPLCHADSNLYQNIKNVLACFSNTLAAALFCESEYIRIFNDFETLSSVVDEEKHLIFDFLSKNGLTEKFNEYTTLIKLKQGKIKVS